MFAIITLILYVVWPIGAILNIIGLFTGPKRGCFVAMFIVCFGGGCLSGLIYGLVVILGQAGPVVRVQFFLTLRFAHPQKGVIRFRGR